VTQQKSNSSNAIWFIKFTLFQTNYNYYFLAYIVSKSPHESLKKSSNFSSHFLTLKTTLNGNLSVHLPEWTFALKSLKIPLKNE